MKHFVCIAFILALLNPSSGVPKGRGYSYTIAVLDGEPDWDLLKEEGVNVCPSQKEVQASGLKASTIFRRHGTNIGLAIWSHLSPKVKKETCLVFVHLFVKGSRTKEDEAEFNMQALYTMLAFHPDAANLSYSGGNPMKEEKELLLTALNLNIDISVAAGNDGEEYNKSRCDAYPACYKYDGRIMLHKNRDKFTVVGARGLVLSNRGDLVDVMEEACFTVEKLGKLCGSSQAAAHFTGRMADLEVSNKLKGGK